MHQEVWSYRSLIEQIDEWLVNSDWKNARVQKRKKLSKGK